jgi:hypothetical protein
MKIIVKEFVKHGLKTFLLIGGTGSKLAYTFLHMLSIMQLNSLMQAKGRGRPHIITWKCSRE